MKLQEIKKLCLRSQLSRNITYHHHLIPFILEDLIFFLVVLVPTNDKSVDTFTVRLKQNIQQDRQFIKMDAKLFNID